MKLAVTLLVAVFTTCGFAQFTPIPGGLRGIGMATTYWDCCKPACAWSNSLNGSSAITPARSCAADGKTTQDADTVMSGCEEDGESFMCNDQQPFFVNSTLAYGFAAASFSGGVDVTKCCSCFLLSFISRSGEDDGKSMVVQITNTRGDLDGNTFDLATPGGGVGLFNRGCMKQWDAPTDGWGNRDGGVTSEEECSQLPETLQTGCTWRFQFLQGLDVNYVGFEQIECPLELIDITGCQ